MAHYLPLDEMTTAEKLEVLEMIWASLRREPENLNPPTWHEAILTERKRRMETGEATVSDWEDAKQRFNSLGRS